MIGLVGCSQQKLDQEAPAGLLYCSQLFQKSLAYARRQRCSAIYVLSARYLLVGLDERIKPYDLRLSKSERGIWAHRVATLLLTRHGHAERYLILAGQDYADPLRAALLRGYGLRPDVAPENIAQPLRGLTVGRRLRWLNSAAATDASG